MPEARIVQENTIPRPTNMEMRNGIGTLLSIMNEADESYNNPMIVDFTRKEEALEIINRFNPFYEENGMVYDELFETNKERLKLILYIQCFGRRVREWENRRLGDLENTTHFNKEELYTMILVLVTAAKEGYGLFRIMKRDFRLLSESIRLNIREDMRRTYKRCRPLFYRWIYPRSHSRRYIPGHELRYNYFWQELEYDDLRNIRIQKVFPIDNGYIQFEESSSESDSSDSESSSESESSDSESSHSSEHETDAADDYYVDEIPHLVRVNGNPRTFRINMTEYVESYEEFSD